MIRRAIVALALAGCTTAAPPPPTPSPAMTLAIEEPAPPGGELALATDGVFPIGEPCEGRWYCGTTGKIAVATQGWRQGEKVPPSACTHLATIPAERAWKIGRSASACVSGGRVFISAGGCMFCRISTGSFLVGDIATMTAEQTAYFQHTAGLPREPRLTTSEAWSRAIAAAAPKY